MGLTRAIVDRGEAAFVRHRGILLGLLLLSSILMPDSLVGRASGDAPPLWSNIVAAVVVPVAGGLIVDVSPLLAMGWILPLAVSVCLAVLAMAPHTVLSEAAGTVVAAAPTLWVIYFASYAVRLYRDDQLPVLNLLPSLILWLSMMMAGLYYLNDLELGPRAVAAGYSIVLAFWAVLWLIWIWGQPRMRNHPGPSQWRTLARIPVLWVSMLSFASVSFLGVIVQKFGTFHSTPAEDFLQGLLRSLGTESIASSVSPEARGACLALVLLFWAQRRLRKSKSSQAAILPVLAGALIAWAACWMRTPPGSGPPSRLPFEGALAGSLALAGIQPATIQWSAGKRHSGFAVGAASAIFQSLFLVLPSNVFDQASSTLAIAVVVAVSAGLLILTAWMLRQHSLRCT